jgi:hypothetical protein
VRNVGREEEELALADGDVALLAEAIDDANDDVTLDLEEELLGRVDVEVLALVGAGDDHDDEVAILPDRLVAHRRLEEVAMLFDPGFEIQG